jgi:hypothetical protein
MCNEFIAELQADSQGQLLTCKQVTTRTPQNDVMLVEASSDGWTTVNIITSQYSISFNCLQGLKKCSRSGAGED